MSQKKPEYEGANPQEILMLFFNGVGKRNGLVVEAFSNILRKINTQEGRAFLLYLLLNAVIGVKPNSQLRLVPPYAIITDVRLLSEMKGPDHGDYSAIIQIVYRVKDRQDNVCVELTGQVFEAKASVVPCEPKTRERQDKQEKKGQEKQEKKGERNISMEEDNDGEDVGDIEEDVGDILGELGMGRQ